MIGQPVTPVLNLDVARSRRRPAEVRLALITSARHVFEHYGFGGATTREIADHAGVNEALIFRHFTNKANLFAKAVYEPFAQLLEDLLRSELSAPCGEDEQSIRQRFVGQLTKTLRENRKLLMAVINAKAYDRELAEIPTLDTFFNASFESVRRLQIAQSADLSVLDKLMRCGFAAVVGSVLFEDWILPGRFEDEAEHLAVITRFVDFGMYGDPHQAQT